MLGGYRMKRLFRKWKWTEYVESALLIVLGILVICFNSSVNLYNAIGYMVATYILINAILFIVSSIIFSVPLLSSDFFIGLVLLIISIGLYIRPLALVQVIPLVIGVGLIGYGLILLTVGLKTFILLGSGTKQILQIVFGIIAVALGSVVIAVHYGTSNNVVAVLFVLLGIILLLAGIGQLVFVLYVSNHAKKFTKFEEEKNDKIVEEYKDK